MIWANSFVDESVQDAGPLWETRFYDLANKLPSHVLSEEKELPAWLRSRPSYDIWKRNNLWMLHNAIARADQNVTLLALWDGHGGDGPGGTEDMVKQAEERNARIIIIDTTNELHG